MTTLKDSTVWITGASSGIGAALAKKVSAEGARVILSGRREGALRSVADQLKTETLILPFEVTDYAGLDARVVQAWAWTGRVDILVNNAGISQRSLALDTAPQVYTDLINIDLIAPIWLTQLQLQKMADAGGGHIVAISSVAGRVGVPLRTGYCAAKHGLIGYMDALRAEVSTAHNIHVTNVLPGSVNTAISENALDADGAKHGTKDDAIANGDDPDDLAIAIIEAIQNNTPETIFAQGIELAAAKLRHDNPQQLFELVAALGAEHAKAT